MSCISFARVSPLGYSVVPSRVTTLVPWGKVSTVRRIVPELNATFTQQSFDPREPFLRDYKRILYSMEQPEEWTSAVTDLSPFTSKYGYMYLLLILQVNWLLQLAEISSADESLRIFLLLHVQKFSVTDGVGILEMYSRAPNVAVPVREYLQRQFHTFKVPQVLKFLASSYLDSDMLSFAHSVMVRRSLDHVVIPKMFKLQQACADLVESSNGKLQATTFEKEFMIVAKGLSTQLKNITNLPVIHRPFSDLENLADSFPDVDWDDVSRGFFTSFGIKYSPAEESDKDPEITSYWWSLKPQGNLPSIAGCASDYNLVLCTFSNNIVKKHSTTIGEEACTKFKLGGRNLSSANALLETCAYEKQEDVLVETLMKGFCLSLLGYEEFLDGIASLQ